MKKIILLNIILIEIFSVTCIAQTATYGPLKSSDRLWNIAASIRPNRSINHFQAMLALLKINPHAFTIPCNLNSLKKGPILYIPSHAEMLALTKNQAIKEFYRQDKEWKDYYKKGKSIVCPQELPVAKTEEVLPVMTQKTVIPKPTEPATPIAQQAPSTETNAVEAIKPVSTEPVKMEPVPTSSTWDSHFQLWLSSPVLLISSGIVIVFALFLFAFFIGRRSGKHSEPLNNNTSLINSSTMEVNPLPVQSVDSSTVASNSVEKMSGSDSEKTSMTPTHPEKNISNKMQEKLDNVRTYLAEDEDQVIQKMLREVIQEGSAEQQYEARQLYEINKKINSFKQSKPQKRVISKPVVSNAVGQDLKQMPEYGAVHQYLPENQDKMFELVDKIFELLDTELNAQGRLIEAHINRSQQPQRVNVQQNYEIVEKSEKLVVEDDKEGKPRAETEPTRYM